MRKFALVAIPVVGLVAWEFASPYFAIDRVRTAAARYDLSAYERLVDRAAVRRSVEAGVRQSLPPSDFRDTLGIGPVIGDALAPGVAEIVSGPQFVSAQLSGRRSVERHGLSSFDVRTEHGAVLRFNRRGLGWVLTGLRLP